MCAPQVCHIDPGNETMTHGTNCVTDSVVHAPPIQTADVGVATMPVAWAELRPVQKSRGRFSAHDNSMDGSANCYMVPPISVHNIEVFDINSSNLVRVICGFNSFRSRGVQHSVRPPGSVPYIMLH